MRSGFYSIRQSGADQDPLDDEAWGLAMLTHFKEGKTVGVDNGGCTIKGDYTDRPDGGIAMHMVYVLRCGSRMPDGTILEADHRLEGDVNLTAETLSGGYQLLNIGLGPMYISLQWLAAPA